MADFYVAVGEATQFSKTVSESDVYLFAGITGDLSPNHVNKAYMEKSSYGRLMAHGALLVGYMSTASTMAIAHTRDADETPVAVGDYVAGPSHVLPTSGTARWASGLTANDFLRSNSVLNFTDVDLRRVASDVGVLADKEGLTAHRASVDIRLGDDDDRGEVEGIDGQSVPADES